MIGHALVQIFRALGYTVVGHQPPRRLGHHARQADRGVEEVGPRSSPVDVGVLNDLYVAGSSRRPKRDPALDDEGRAWFKRLEDGDAEALALWSRFKDVSLAEYQTVYDLLGVKFDVVKGESEYVPDVPRILQELADEGPVERERGRARRRVPRREDAAAA